MFSSFIAVAMLNGIGCAPSAPSLPSVDKSALGVLTDLPSGPKSLAPHLLNTPAGLRLTWLEPHPTGHALLSSVWAGSSWTPPVTLTESGSIVANWADTPNAVVAGDGSLVVSYPRKSGEGTYAYDVRLMRSTDGLVWTDLGSPHDDGTQTEHGFTSFVAEGEGFRIFWLDGRETAHEGPMTLRTAVWTGEFSGETVVDERVCDCCGTAAAQTPGGWMAVYRDRTEGEIRDTRAATASGTVPVGADGWQMPGCPVNGPRLVSTPLGELAAWTTGADGSEIRVAMASNGAFAEPVVLAPARHMPVGRVDLLQSDSSTIATWLGTDGIMGRRLHPTEMSVQAGPSVLLAAAEGSRGTGFPRSQTVDDSLITVWTTPDGLKAVQTPLNVLDGATAALPPVDAAPVAALTTRPKLQGTTLAGEPWSLESMKGPVFVALWASWCGPCRAELPALRELASRSKVPLVVVAVDDKPEAIQRAASEAPGTWVVASRADVEQAFRTATVPATWLFNTEAPLWSAMGQLQVDEALAASENVP